MKLAKVFLAGLLISFIGSLPLGTLNVAAFQITITNGTKTAIWFALGCILIEMIYVRLSLVAMQWVARHQKFLRWIGVFAFLLTTTLAVLSFSAASSDIQNMGRVNFTKIIHPLLLGLTMSAVNPAQIPFWFGFSTVLFSKKILLPLPVYYNWYILGIAVGSVMASFIFIFGGQYMVNKLGTNEVVLNLIIGGCFTIAALFQMWKLKNLTSFT